MNLFVGGWSGWPWLQDNQYKVHHKYADVGSSSQLFTFIEMPAQSINAGRSRAANIAIIAITTSSSISVNALISCHVPK